jgi:hypothetical protein
MLPAGTLNVVDAIREDHCDCADYAQHDADLDGEHQLPGLSFVGVAFHHHSASGGAGSGIQRGTRYFFAHDPTHVIFGETQRRFAAMALNW